MTRLIAVPVGAQVVLTLPGRVLLGDVTGYVITPHGAVYLRVRHFNGEPWPVSPRAGAVEVLEHTNEGETIQ